MTTLVLPILNGSSSFLHKIKDNYESLDEFEFPQDSITDFGSSCPWASDKLMNNVVTTLAPSFMIGSSSFLQATS